jgi:RHO1 GDP-GTP exchange protein 1/2
LIQPIPLDLLTLATFTDPPTQRGGGLIPFRGKGAAHTDGINQGPTLSGLGSPDSVSDARVVYPCTLHHNGRLGGLYTLFAETAQARSEWKTKLEEAIGLRKVVQESNKVFEVETLSIDTFLAPSLLPPNPSWNNDNILTGKVTCSVPFSKPHPNLIVLR